MVGGNPQAGVADGYNNTRGWFTYSNSRIFKHLTQPWSVLNDLRALAKRLREEQRQPVQAKVTYPESHRWRMDYAAARPVLELCGR